MAHFAELDENNIVKRVLVVNNEDILNSNGIESEEIGIDYLKSLFGSETNWKQTSYNSSFRSRYAGIDFTYDSVLDSFISPKPFASWILNTNTTEWEAPVPFPTDILPDGSYYSWDEENLKWILKT